MAAAAVLPIGFTSLDIDRRTDARIHASTYVDGQGNVQLDLHTWGDTVLYSKDTHTNWLDVLALGRNFQCGSFNSTGVAQSRIYFTIPFDTAPKVVVWLNGFNIASTGASYRVSASPSDITPSSFVIDIASWGDTIFHGASAYWIAIPSNQSDITSGIFNTEEVRPWAVWQLNNSKSITFDKPFPTIPRVVAAFHGLDMGGSANIRARVTISDVSTTQFIWHLDSWSDTVFYDAWASYIAAIDPLPTPATSTSTPASPKTNLGAIIGGIVGGLVAIAALVVLFLLCRRRRRRRFSDSIRDENLAVDTPVRSIAAPSPTVVPYFVREPVSSSTIHLATPGSTGKRRDRPAVNSNNRDENTDASTRVTPAPIIAQHVDSGIRTASGGTGSIIELPPVYTSV